MENKSSWENIQDDDLSAVLLFGLFLFVFYDFSTIHVKSKSKLDS